MLDYRKPYVIDIEDRRKELNMRDDERNVPSIAIGSSIEKWDDGDGKEKPSLFYYDIGCERGHKLQGKIMKDLPNGIVFYVPRLKWQFTLTELTMEQFEKRIRPLLDENVSAMLNDLDDVYTWYRQMVGIN